MALSQADFYAYSRATGAPVPRDPEEQARMAPEVLEFRRNQLKSPEPQEEQSFGLPQALGIGAALAGIGAGGFGISRLLRQKPPVAARESVIRPATVDIESPVRRVVTEVAAKPEVTPEVKPSRVPDPWGAPTAPPRQQARGFSPREYVESTGALAPEDLTSVQESQRNFVVQQQVEAVDAGLDQAVDNAVVIPTQRDVTSFQSFSQRADQISNEAAAQRAAIEALAAQRSKAPKNARMLQSLGPKYGLTQDEIFHRISASASDYRPGSMNPLTQLDVAALLDPTVPTDSVKDLLGTTLAVRGGRVGRNLDYEVMAEGAGMTEREAGVGIVGDRGSDVYAFNPRTGQFEIDETADLEDLNLIGGRTSDYETNAADYGDVEGPGGFVSTRGFKERTKSGTTIIPGQATETAGTLKGSERQEREIDRVLPARESLEGDPASGWAFDPETGRAYLVGTGVRLKPGSVETQVNLAGKPVRVVKAGTTAKRPSSTDPSVLVSTGAGGRARELGEYQGQILVDDPSYDPTSGGKLRGRVQPATAEPSVNISTQPVTGYMSAKERLIQDEKGNWYVNQAKTKVVGEEPLRGYVGSDPNIRDLTLNRDELTGVLNKGAELWSAKGGGSPLERQTFLIQQLDGYLKTQKNITLPVLQPNKKGFISSAAFDFINNIQPGIKESNVYVKPAKVNAEGRPLVSRQTSGAGYVKEVPLIDPEYMEMEAVPLPGQYKVTGAGGVDVREIDEAIDERARTYFSPLLETASQQKVMRLGQSLGVPAETMIGATTTPLGQQLSALRSEMETSPVGYKVKSPGSFARTQNPYTGAAAAAMGPASRVSSGNYQYPEQQLSFRLEPTSQRALDERNRFALTANLTPGGRVVRGGLQLGQGLGAIEAGLGTLSESETIARYGASGSQLQELGNKLMAQAAYKRGQQPGPTRISAVEKTPPPGGSAQPFIPGVLESSPLTPRGYTPNAALDFYTRALEQEATQLAANPPKERLVRRQGRMVPLSKVTQPVQRNVFFQRG